VNNKKTTLLSGFLLSEVSYFNFKDKNHWKSITWYFM